MFFRKTILNASLAPSNAPSKSRSMFLAGLTNKAVNKDGRLIRLDYVFRKNRACGALKHNQSYQTPRLLFLSF
jgi:hypothetical protein